jgi:trypsin
MGTTRLTHGLPRWVWGTVATVLLVALTATIAVTTPGSPTDSPGTPPAPTAGPSIVGGRAAQPGEYPFAVALLRSSASSHYDAQFCGGSLIGPDLVLTAAHCVAGESPALIDVLVGTHDLLAGGQRIGVQQIHIHPAYEQATTVSDVAVLELDRLATQPTLVAVADPADLSAVAPGTPATVVGWGSTKTDGYPTALRTVSVPIVSDESCRDSYGRQVVESVMVCAGNDHGGRDSCSGDSGGPLMVRPDDTWLQVGVVSWGYGCALPGLPGVYAEAPALIDFLGPFLTGFRDIPMWAADAIDWISDAGHANGFPDRTFRPNYSLTRAQAVQILHAIVAPPEDAYGASPHGFADVPAWIDTAVRWATDDPDDAGPASAPMSGYGDATFRPDEAITRGAFSRLLWRLADSPDEALHGFTDVADWVTEAVSWIAAEGHATGWPDGTFRPAETLTRAQATRMLYRINGDGGSA